MSVRQGAGQLQIRAILPLSCLSLLSAVICGYQEAIVDLRRGLRTTKLPIKSICEAVSAVSRMQHPPLRSHRPLVAGHGDVFVDSQNVPQRGTGLHLNPYTYTYRTRNLPLVSLIVPRERAFAFMHTLTTQLQAASILTTR